MMVILLETKLPANEGSHMAEFLGFDSNDGVDANGLSGGIWMLWDSIRISVDILPHSKQAIHAFVKESSTQVAQC